jgi:hypothetical protein
MGGLVSRRTASLAATAAGVLALAFAGVGQAAAPAEETTKSAGQHGSADQHLPPSSSNVEIVGQLEVTGAFGDVAEGQIADVGVFKDHAYLASWSEPDCERGGFFVADISDPAHPEEVAFVPALPDTYHGEGVHAITMDTASFSGDVLAVNNEPCTTDGEGGFDLYDVSDPENPEPLKLAAGDRSPDGSLEQDPTEHANSAHSVFLWQDGGRAFAVIVDNTEEADVDIFEITDPRNPVQIADFDLDATFPEVVGPSAHGNTIFHHDMVVKEIDGIQTMLVSYWDAGYVQLNVEDPANPTLIQDTDFAGDDPLTGLNPPEGNAHEAEFTHDNRYFLAADEDFSAYRTDFEITTGPNAGPYESGEFGFSVPIATLPDQELNGPTVFGGYGCDADNDIPPRASAGLRPLAEDEEAILVVQRGPVDDPSAPYPACRFDEKMQNAIDAGYDGILIAQRHEGSEEADGAFCGSGEPRDIAGMCISHEAMHRIFGETPSYERPYTRPNPDEPDPGQLGEDVSATATFDGWGYAHLFDRVTGEELDAWAIPEAVDERFAFGFGDLSIHEFATDPSTNLAYAAYYAGGFRVVAYGEDGIEQVGHLIPEGGMNLWGVEQFTADDGSRLIAVSDRDYGLFILRYTGPGAVGPTPPAGGGGSSGDGQGGGAGGGGGGGDQGGGGQQGGAPPTVVVQQAGRADPIGVRLRVVRRVRRGATTLVSTGRVLRPSGVGLGACFGRVQVVVKAGRGFTVSMRTARLRPDCTFRSQVTFRLPQRLGRALKVRAIFGGNDQLRRATSDLVRFGGVRR